MPRSTREYLLRFADQAKGDLERASSNLQTMAVIYGERKPEHTQFLLALVTLRKVAKGRYGRYYVLE